MLCRVKQLAFVMVLLVGAGCRIGGSNALPPLDADPNAGPDARGPDAMLPDAGCETGVNDDGDGADNCTEADDGNDYTDPAVFNGLKAIIGDNPGITGSCNSLDDFAEMDGHFSASTTAMNVYAGWEFDTAADSYNDPSYGFTPNWSSATAGQFSVRYSGNINLTGTGMHCFKVDVGATGTGIVTGKNMCAQIWVNAGTGGGQVTDWLAETGYQAEAADANEACVTLNAGEYSFDIVYWYFNVLERSQLEVRYCFGDTAACTPDQPIGPDMLHAAP